MRSLVEAVVNRPTSPERNGESFFKRFEQKSAPARSQCEVLVTVTLATEQPCTTFGSLRGGQ
jgi:hypothetical protein